MRLDKRQTRAIYRLQESVLECGSCPTERHCCYLDDKFGMYIRDERAEQIFGRHLPGLVSTKVLAPFGDRYRVQRRCPLLDEDRSCMVHDYKEDLDLWECAGFPMWLTRTDDDHGIVSDWFMIDYRCFSVEKNWPSLDERLRKSAPEGRIRIAGIMPWVLVRYLKDDRMHKKELKAFRSELEQGLIGPQKLSTSERREEIIHSDAYVCSLEIHT